jgi:shikimate dehydrogenase
MNKTTKDTRLITSLAGKQNNIGAAMHNAGYAANTDDFLYIPITTDDIESAIQGVRGLNLVGSTVSMPHKQNVMQYLDKIDSIAERIGAVNTVANVDGTLTGYNSDWVGALAALEEATEVVGKKVLVIGAGGAARAIVYGLTQKSAEVSIYGRTEQNARSLAEDFDVNYGGSIDSLNDELDYDIVINATSVGFGTDECVAPESLFKPGTVALDVVFMPAETTFLKNAKRMGAIVVPGYRMLIHQALFQMELFTGKKAPFDVMEKALMQAIEDSKA